jgi:hypothetical protein
MFLKYNLALWKMALEKSPITSEIGYNSDPIFCRYHERAATVAVAKPPKMLLKEMISPEPGKSKRWGSSRYSRFFNYHIFLALVNCY